MIVKQFLVRVCGSAAAPKRKAFDQGGPVWPPRSNVTNDRLGGGLGGLCPPSQNPGGLGGSAPQPKFFKKKQNVFKSVKSQVKVSSENAGGPGGGSPPAKPVKGGGSGGALPPPAKIRGVWGAPPSQKFSRKKKQSFCFCPRNFFHVTFLSP